MTTHFNHALGPLRITILTPCSGAGDRMGSRLHKFIKKAPPAYFAKVD